jgi:hypothetical protein
LGERDHLVDPGLDGDDNIKMDFQKVGSGKMDCFELDQDRDRRQALLNVVMDLRVT